MRSVYKTLSIIAKFTILSVLLIVIPSCCVPGYRIYQRPTPVDDGSILVSDDYPGRLHSPIWDPAGNKIVALVEFNFPVIIDLSENSITPLTNLDWITRGIAWSPDGKRIAFGSTDLEPEGIWVSSIDNNETEPMYFTGGHAVDWSPNNRFLAIGDVPRDPGVIQPTQPTQAIFKIYDSENNDVVIIFEDVQYYPGFGDVEWSPDGKLVAFIYSHLLDEEVSTESISFTKLYIYDLERDTLDVIVDKELGGDTINWSEDSSRILTILDSSIGETIFQIVDLEGACHEIRAQVEYMSHPKLSPDYTKIAFEGPGSGIYTVETGLIMPPNYWNSGGLCADEVED